MALEDMDNETLMARYQGLKRRIAQEERWLADAIGVAHTIEGMLYGRGLIKRLPE